jgi:hypothetical protein
MALLGLLAVAVMVFAYVLTSRLNAASRFVGIDREHNAKVLSQAKQALVGWMAINAATDNNPGRLPCPEAVNAIGTDSEGISAPLVTPSTPNCATVGRLPWRTLGLNKIVDAVSEPLWYVVSPEWALQTSSTLLSINSDKRGQMTVDGQPAPNEVVALIIAPGPAMNVQAAAGCTARAQARATPAPAMDPLDYIECFNAGTPAFATTGPATSFNDQVVRVTVGDLMPALEAAIAERMQREIAPVLRTVYTSSQYSGIPSSSPLYPYAAPFANPGTANFQGVAGTYQGLLPFNQTQGCNPATDARCTTTLVSWSSPSPAAPPTAFKAGGFGFIRAGSQSCSWQSGGAVALCSGEYQEDSGNPWGSGMVIAMTATINNVAMGLRFLDTTKATIEAENNVAGGFPLQTVTPSIAATMNSNGSVTITFSGTLPVINAMTWDTWALYRIRLERSVIGDHFLLDPATTGPGAATSWYARNQWYRVTYYAAAQQNTAGALSSFGCNNTNCLRFNEGLGCGGGANWCNMRALLVLGGASLSNPAGRPNGNLADYFEYTNADGGTFYEQHPMRRATNVANANGPWNDRVILVDWPASLPPLLTGTHPQVVSVSPLRVYVLP